MEEGETGSASRGNIMNGPAEIKRGFGGSEASSHDEISLGILSQALSERKRQHRTDRIINGMT